MSWLLYNEKFKISEDPKNSNELLSRCIAEKDTNSYFLIVPTGKYERKLKNQFITRYYQENNEPAGKLNVFTIKSFVRYCIDQFFGPGTYYHISEAYQLALFEDAASETEFQIYKKNESNSRIFPAVLERLAGIISGLREDGILPENMEDDLRSESDEITDRRRLSDIYGLYKNYLKKLGDKFLDYPGSLFLLTEFAAANKDKINSHFGDKLILLHGFSEFKLPEADLLRTFAETETKFAINIDFDSVNGPLFGNLYESLERLNPRENGFFRQADMLYDNIEEKWEALNYSDADISLTLRKWLFNTEKRIHNSGFSETLMVFSAENIEDEVESTTKLVKYLILEEKYKPYEICIVFRNPDKYSDYFRRSFYNNRIPANVSDRFNLNMSIVSGAVFSVLNLVLYDFKREDVFKSLLNPLLTFGDNENKIDISAIQYSAGKLRIFGGRLKGGIDYWVARLEDAVVYYEEIIKAGAFDEDDDMYAAALEKDLETYRSALKSIKYLKSTLLFENKKYSPDEFKDIIKNKILSKFGIIDNIVKLLDEVRNTEEGEPAYHKVLELEKNSRAYTKLIEVIEEMTFVLNDIYGEKKFTLRDLVEKFKTSVSAARYQVKERQRYGVEITSVEQTRGIDYKVMILCGATDGEFPIKYRTETMLGKELADSADRHLRSEQMQFYQFLTNNADNLDRIRQKIYIFYPKASEEKELIRSHFIDAALRIATSPEENKCEFDLKEIRSNRGKYDGLFPWLDSITTGTEMLEYLALKDETVPDNRYEAFAQSLEFINNNSAVKKGSEVRIDRSENFSQIFRNKTYSVSELDQYASCPYKYFTERLLKPEVDKEYDRGLSPLEYGNMLHIILQKFYNRIIYEEAGEMKRFETGSGKLIMGAKLKPSNYELYHTILHEIAEAEFGKFNIHNPIFNLEKNKIIDPEKGWLTLWLNSEINRTEKLAFFPAMFELSFGVGEQSFIPNVDMGNFKLKGKIDRIELMESKEGDSLFMIADYKSTKGSVKTRKDIESGRSFQMPLYLKAADKILNESYGESFIPAAAVYYPVKIVRDSNAIKDSFIVLASAATDFLKGRRGPLEIPGAIERSVKLAEELIEKMQDGVFDVDPSTPRECTYCDFGSICRINEVR